MKNLSVIYLLLASHCLAENAAYGRKYYLWGTLHGTESDDKGRKLSTWVDLPSETPVQNDIEAEKVGRRVCYNKGGDFIYYAGWDKAQKVQCFRYPIRIDRLAAPIPGRHGYPSKSNMVTKNIPLRLDGELWGRFKKKKRPLTTNLTKKFWRICSKLCRKTGKKQDYEFRGDLSRAALAIPPKCICSNVQMLTKDL